MAEVSDPIKGVPPGAPSIPPVHLEPLGATPESFVPDDENLITIVKRWPRLSLRELTCEVWPGLPWEPTSKDGDSATERIREWQIALRPGVVGNRVERCTAAAWLLDQMQNLVLQGRLAFARRRRDEPDVAGQASYVLLSEAPVPRRLPRMGRSSLATIGIIILAGSTISFAEPVDLVTQGRLALYEGKSDLARTFCRRAVPTSRRPDALTCLGEVELTQGRYHLAVRLGEAALKIRGSIATHLLIAQGWRALQRCEWAMSHFEEVLIVDPDNRVAQEGLAACAPRPVADRRAR